LNWLFDDYQFLSNNWYFDYFLNNFDLNDWLLNNFLDDLFDNFGLEINLLTEIRLFNEDLRFFVDLLDHNLGRVFLGFVTRLR
jgi:hypothetical protein